jgi:hypothetical protein
MGPQPHIVRRRERGEQAVVHGTTGFHTQGPVQFCLTHALASPRAPLYRGSWPMVGVAVPHDLRARCNGYSSNVMLCALAHGRFDIHPVMSIVSLHVCQVNRPVGADGGPHIGAITKKIRHRNNGCVPWSGVHSLYPQAYERRCTSRVIPDRHLQQCRILHYKGECMASQNRCASC